MAALDAPAPLGAGFPGADPFSLTPDSRKPSFRHNGIENVQTHSLTNGSPTQAKSALQARIAETDRRIRDASRLGKNLLEQKEQLAHRLKDVESQQTSSEIDPELRKKLAELERDYDELERDTARSRTRINGTSVDETTVFSSERAVSPAKPAAPMSSRKQRNTAGRVEDLAFATEISTSLLGQVRHLQNVLAEKDEALRQANIDNSRLQDDADHVNARLKALDENEQRYKDENWHLDTQVQDLSNQLQDTMSRHQRTESTLKSAQAEKANVEREGDDLRLAHAKLTDEHAVLRKRHDTELAALRRNLTSGDADKETLQAKIAELTSQNEDLARAVAHRMRSQTDEQPSGAFLDSEEETRNVETSDESPPASPTKGTPRHGVLETETLKSSLHHAHRMIQNLKNNIHREKTEKVELRRMLQDARDEVESRRADTGMANRNKNKKQISDNNLFKKPARPDRLGARASASEEILDDPSWEEYDESPTRQVQHRHIVSHDSSTDASDAFETANEADSTDAFETAESVVGDDTEGDETETEASQAQPLRQRPSQLRHVPAGSRSSFLSTASDDGDPYDLTPPPRQQEHRFRFPTNRDRLRQSSATPNAKDSPASFVSNSSQSSQITAKNDLAAELEDMDDRSSVADSTPSRSMHSNRSSPEDERKRQTRIRIDDGPLISKPQMVHSGTLTDPWEPQPSKAAESGVLGAVAGAGAAGLAALGLRSRSEEPEPERSAEDAEDREGQDSGFGLEPRTPMSSTKAYVDQGYQPSPMDSKTGTEEQAQGPEMTASRSTPALGFSSLATQFTRTVTPPTPIPGFASPTPDRLASALSDPATARSTGEEAVATPPTTSVPFAFSTISTQHVTPIASSRPVVASGIGAAPSSSPQKFSQGFHLPPIDPNAMAATPSKAAPSMAAVDRILKLSRESSPQPTDRTIRAPSASSVNRTPLSSGKRAGSQTRAVDDVFVSDSARASPAGSENANVTSSYLPPTQTGRVPLAPVSGNDSPKKSTSNNLAPSETKTEGTQTMVSADEIDRLLQKDSQRPTAIAVPPSPVLPAGSIRPKAPPPAPMPAPELTERSPRRPGSNNSLRNPASSPPPFGVPPLPTNHREQIAAASRTSSLQGPAPPNFSQQLRPQTPSGTFTRGTSPSGAAYSFSTPTRQPHRRPSVTIPGREGGTATRRSSISSFASEVDERLNPAGAFSYPANIDPETTDPRMIQAITQTMIGEFMWKYTRKTGSSTTQSSNRHKRFFWIHPYTRTLYWSIQDPSRQGTSRSELKAKSVSIEAVRVVTDDNPSPPGLWQKSIVILTPGKGRSIKFTAPTSMRHETWFNALSYLLLRNNAADRVEDISNATSGATTTYPTLRSARQSASVRGSSTTVNTTSGGRIYSNVNPSLSEQGRGNTLNSLTNEDISEFNPTLHPNGRSNSRVIGSSSYRSLRSHSSVARRLESNTASPAKGQYGSATGRTSAASGAFTQASSNSSYNPSPATTRTKDVNSLATANLASSSTASNTTAPGNPPADTTPDPQIDDQGFRIPPRPVAPSSTNTASDANTAHNPNTGRLSSMTSRSRAAVGSLFSRSRSMSRARASQSQSQLHSQSQSNGAGMAGIDHEPSSGAPSLNSQDTTMGSDTTVHAGSREDVGESMIGRSSDRSDRDRRPTSRSGAGHTVENVRACCDGKHDVAHLSHNPHHGSISNSMSGHSHSQSSSQRGRRSQDAVAGQSSGSVRSRLSFGGGR